VNRKLVFGLGFMLALVFCPSAAFSHARLLRSQPAANSTLKQSPKVVELWFSEELQPPMCSITVTDKDGNRVDKNNASLAEENKKLQIDLEELKSGTYTVDWRVLSTDEHTMKGNFTFTVALAGGAASAPAQTPSPGTQRAPDQPAPMQSMPQAPTTTGRQESGTSWIQSLVRWLEYLAMMMLFGGFAFHVLVLGPSLRRTRGIDEVKRAVGLSTSARRVLFFSWLSLALLVFVSLTSLILQVSTVFDKSVGEALSPGLLNQVIAKTGFGSSWRLEVWAILVLLIIVFYLSRYVKREPTGKYAIWWWMGISVGAVLFLARGWTGHAVVAARDFPFAVGTDWLHLLAAGFWVGGLFHLALTMPKAISILDGRGRLRVLHQVIPLFTRLAIASTFLIVLTGLYNSWMHVDRFAELWSTSYGGTLLLKVLLVIPMFVLGGINTFIIHPRAARLIENEENAPEAERIKLARSFYRSVRIEAVLGGLVLLVASLLVFLQPAREHQMLMTQAPAADSVVISR
jgi:copper transport protein